jgi:hypothetical protein
MTRTVEIAEWLARNLWWWPLMVPVQYLVAIVGDRFSDRIRARSDERLRAKVMLAASRLPSGVRAAYEREWQAELQHILHGQHARPGARLRHGLRYARGLRTAARSITRSYEGHRTVLQRLGRMAARSARTVALVPFLALLMVIVAILTVEAVVVAIAAVFVTPVRKIVTGGTLTGVYRHTFVTGMRFAPVSWDSPTPEVRSGTDVFP